MGWLVGWLAGWLVRAWSVGDTRGRSLPQCFLPATNRNVAPSYAAPTYGLRVAGSALLIGLFGFQAFDEPDFDDGLAGHANAGGLAVQ
jgi:hypothetical protein